MVRFYRDVPGFVMKEKKDAGNAYLIKDNTLFAVNYPAMNCQA